MSHVEPPTPVPDTAPAPDPDPAPAPVPNPAPTPVPDHAPKDEGDRVSSIETMVTNLTETVTSLIEAIAGTENDDAKPQKLPWTAWGSRNKS